jgi:hypothetical protein
VPFLVVRRLGQFVLRTLEGKETRHEELEEDDAEEELTKGDGPSLTARLVRLVEDKQELAVGGR